MVEGEGGRRDLWGSERHGAPGDVCPFPVSLGCLLLGRCFRNHKEHERHPTPHSHSKLSERPETDLLLQRLWTETEKDELLTGFSATPV